MTWESAAEESKERGVKYRRLQGSVVGTHFAGVLLLVDDRKCILRGLPLGLGQGPFHFRALCRDHLVSLPLSVRDGFL